jgi:hypothetical protein
MDGSTEFLFIFRARERAQAASDELSALGYACRVVGGDGEGRLFQLRLTFDGAVRRPEGETLFRDVLAPVVQRHRGSLEALLAISRTIHTTSIQRRFSTEAISRRPPTGKSKSTARRGVSTRPATLCDRRVRRGSTIEHRFASQQGCYKTPVKPGERHSPKRVLPPPLRLTHLIRTR